MKEENEKKTESNKLYFKPLNLSYLKPLRLPKNTAGNVSGYIRTETINEVAVRVARRRNMK